MRIGAWRPGDWFRCTTAPGPRPVGEVAQCTPKRPWRVPIIRTSSKGSKPIRKIEKLMNEAITTSKNWRMDNTEVVTEGNVSTVFLHGGKIAEIGDNWLRLFDGGHRTNTTKSRLNAILSVHGGGFDAIFQKNFEWFFHDSMRSRLFLSRAEWRSSK